MPGVTDHDDTRASRPPSALSIGAAALLSLSAFLLYTLVLNEHHMGDKMTLLKDSAVMIGAPAVAGLVLVALTIVRSRRR